MPVPLSLPERLLVRLGIIPAPMVDFVQHASIRLLLAAHRLGIFDELATGPRSLEELCERLRTDRAALEMLLDLLCRLDYLTLRGGRYRNTRAASVWLTERSPRSLKGILGFLDDFFSRWEHLEATVRDGRPPFTAYDFYRDNPERWAAFHDGQATIARFTDDEVARKARLRGGPLRLIDIGGSHGLYTIALCRRFPDLSATIFDWPEGIEAGRRGIEASGLSDRIITRVGDFLRDDLGAGYDVALLGNIVHGHGEAEVSALLRRVHAALTESGTLLIVDQVRMRRLLTPFAGYVAQLTGFMLLNELGGTVYPYAQLRHWLRAAGFRSIRLHRLRGTPGFVLVQADVSPRGPAPTRR